MVDAGIERDEVEHFLRTVITKVGLLKNDPISIQIFIGQSR